MGLFSDIGDFFSGVGDFLGDAVSGATDFLGGIFGGGGRGGSGNQASALQQLGKIMTQTGQLMKPQTPPLFPSVRESEGGSLRMGMPTSSQPIVTSDPAKSLYLALYILSQMMNRPQEPLPGPPVGISPDYGYGPGFYTPMLRPPY